jgi:hypothetical protein
MVSDVSSCCYFVDLGCVPAVLYIKLQGILLPYCLALVVCFSVPQ